MCDIPTTAEEVQAGADELVFGIDETDSLAEQRRAFLEVVSCLREPAELEVLAAAHRALGLNAFVSGDVAGGRASFRAARKLQPTFVWPDELLLPDDAARLAYENVNGDTSAVEVPAPAAGRLLFDGAADTQRPTARATVFQRVDGAGEHVDAAYLWPSDALPAYPLPAPPDPAIRTRRIGLLAGAGGAAVTSAVLFGLASAAASTYRDPATPYEDGPGLRSRANGLSVGSAITGTAAVGLGVGALLQGRL